MNFSTEWDYSQVVSPENLERELKWVRAAAAGAAQGAEEAAAVRTTRAAWSQPFS
jgi:hypothetical protein